MSTFLRKPRSKGREAIDITKTTTWLTLLPEKIKATSPAEARRKYKEHMENDFNFDNYEHFSETTKIVIESVTEGGDPNVKDPADEAMTAAKPTKYHFIPSDDKLNQNEGFCVFDVLVGLYAKDVNVDVDAKLRKINNLSLLPK